MKTYKQGISLIVLVITVIVLAILASVVIISLSNSNIITEAEEAVDEYNLKQYEQQLSLAYASWMADNRGATFTTSNISELEEHGFKTTDLPEGYIVMVENKAPVLIELDVWDGGYPTDTTTFILSGEGTESSPYLINSASDLAFLSAYVNAGNNMLDKYIKLTTNIDLAGKAWTPIGNSNINYFVGNFDGNNKTIYNISGESLIGQLGHMDYQNSSHIVKNLNMKGGNVTEAAFVKTVWFGGQVNNCINYSVTSSKAGIVSNLEYGGTITNCKNYATITGEKVAGIAYSGNDLYIRFCTNYGDVIGTNNASGIMYLCSGMPCIENCVNAGTVSAPTAGAIFGMQQDVFMGTTSGNSNIGTINATTTIIIGL